MAALVVWYGSGMGYLMSVIFPPESSLTAAVAAAMVLGGFLNGVQPRLRTLATFAKHALSKLLRILFSAAFVHQTHGASCFQLERVYQVLYGHSHAARRRRQDQSMIAVFGMCEMLSAYTLSYNMQRICHQAS